MRTKAHTTDTSNPVKPDRSEALDVLSPAYWQARKVAIAVALARVQAKQREDNLKWSVLANAVYSTVWGGFSAIMLGIAAPKALVQHQTGWAALDISLGGVMAVGAIFGVRDLLRDRKELAALRRGE